MDYSTLDLQKPLPDKFFDLDEYRAALRDILTAPREATAAWRDLQDCAAEVEDIETDPKQVSNEKLSDWYNGHRNATNSATFFTSAQKKEQLDVWENLYKRVKPFVTSLQCFVGKYGDIATYDAETNTITIDKQTADDMAKATATHPTPPMAFEHWHKMQEALKAIVALRTWEEERDLKHIPLDRLLTRDADDFARFWYADNYAANGQKPLLENYL